MLVAEHGARLLPECVHVCPPSVLPFVEAGRLRFARTEEKGGAAHPIDFLLRSLAREYREKAIGIVLSGTGSDGTVGLRAIRTAGGMAMAEAAPSPRDPLTGRAGQPEAADVVVPVRRMPALLGGYVRHPYVGRNGATREASIGAREMAAVLTRLEDLTGRDFGRYASDRLERRIRRRMAIREAASLSGYLRIVGHDPDEVQRLERDLFLKTTGFPSRRDTWEKLRRELIEPLVRSAAKGSRLRVWAPCCATGEDAYTLAILLCDSIATARPDLEALVFATDLDPVMVQMARSGIFPDLNPATVPADLLQRYFVHSVNGYQVTREVRQRMAFAVHHILNDPPFPDLDLVVGRGFLAQLHRKQQDMLLSAFRFSLRPSGALLAGDDDPIGDGGGTAVAICEGWRLDRLERLEANLIASISPAVWLEAPKRLVRRPRAPRRDSLPPAESDLTAEEIRTLHGELRAVNARLLARVSELERVNDALSNLIAGSEATTLFLDRRLRVQRVTPPVRGVLSLGPADVGRAIAATGARGVDPSLGRDARRALLGELVQETEVVSPSGRCYVRRLLSHRTPDDRIGGVMATYTDITRIRRTRDELAQRLSQQAGVAELGQLALGTLDTRRLTQRAVRIIGRLLKTDFTGILELRAGRGDLILRSGLGWRKGFVGRCCVPAGNKSHPGYALEVGRPLIVPDLRAQRRFLLARLVKAHGVISAISAVIEGPEGAYGVIAGYTRKRRQFGEDDLIFLRAASNVLSLALQRGQARHRLERLNAELEERVAHRTSMLRLQQDVASAANAAESVERAARFALERICRSTAWDAGRVTAVADDLAGELLPSGVWYASGDERARSLRRSLASRARHGERRGRTEGPPAVSFPVKVDREVVALLELFSKDRVKPDGRLLDVLSYVGSELGCVITRKRAERRIRDSERLMQAVFQAAPAALARLDPAGRIHAANPVFAELLGLTARAAPGTSLHRMAHPADRGALARALREPLSSSSTTRRIDLRLARRDGSMIQAELELSAARDQGGRLRQWVAVLYDAGERRRVEREIVRAAEDEVLRMGRDLHDGLGQQLTGIEILAQALNRRAAARPLEKDLSVLHESIREAKDQLRAIVRGKMPVEDHPRGLMRALKRLAEVAHRMFGVTCVLECPRSVLVGDTTVASHLFRIAQEALHNAVRHGRAGRVVIRLSVHRGRLALRVRDDGAGPATRSDAPAGFGLRIARHRAVLIGASLDVRARPGAGYLVECVVPHGGSNGGD